jgi:hypothetical protein
MNETKLSAGIADQLAELPVEVPERKVYWACGVKGTHLNFLWKWSSVCSTQAEVVLRAIMMGCSIVSGPYQTTIEAELIKARAHHRLGVALIAYVSGSWQTIREWPADVPIPEGER